MAMIQTDKISNNAACAWKIALVSNRFEKTHMEQKLLRAQVHL